MLGGKKCRACLFSGIRVLPGHTDPSKFVDGNPYIALLSANGTDPPQKQELAALAYSKRAVEITARLNRASRRARQSLGPRFVSWPWLARADNAAYVQEVGYAQVTANQSGITSEVNLTGLSVSVPVIVGHRYRATVQAQVSVQTSASSVRGQIFQDAVVIGRWASSQTMASGDRDLYSGAAITTNGTNGTVTFKATLAIATGTGSTTLEAAASVPAYILVEDLGVA
jgi:hypothetical protein